MNIEGYISVAEMEIERLKEDIFYATSDVTIRVIENAIHKREETIKSVREKYGKN